MCPWDLLVGVRLDSWTATLGCRCVVRVSAIAGLETELELLTGQPYKTGSSQERRASTRMLSTNL